MSRSGSSRGFTLVEMSLVLVVIGLVIMIVFPALSALRISIQQQTTTANLTALLRATAAYTQANGCLPCPTPASTIGDGFGRVRGDTNTSPCGGCTIVEGVAPFVSLSLPLASAKDGWGRWITMRVDKMLTTNFGVAPPTSACLSSDPLPCVTGESRKGLCQPNLAKSDAVKILIPAAGTLDAAILFMSHGANGFGAYYADSNVNERTNNHKFNGMLTPCTTTGGYERCNASNDASKFFVSASLSNNPDEPFDDQLVYLGRNALVTLLGNQACQSAW